MNKVGIINQIAKEAGFETLKEQWKIGKSDRLDFREIHVTRFREALIKAYEAGRKNERSKLNDR